MSILTNTREEDFVSLKILDLLVSNESNEINYFTSSLIKSYNSAIKNILNIIKKGIKIDLDKNRTYNLITEDIKIEYPTFNNNLITVPVAFSNNLNYYMTITCRFKQIIVENGQPYIIDDNTFVPLVHIPLMVGSDYCLSLKGNKSLDPFIDNTNAGGYHILGGNKRNISFRYKLKYNEILILPHSKVIDYDNYDINDLTCDLYSKRAFEYPSHSFQINIKYENNLIKLYIREKEQFVFNLMSVIIKLSSLTDKQILNKLTTDVLSTIKESIINIVSLSLSDAKKNIITDEQMRQIKNVFVHIEEDDLCDYLFFCLKKYLRVSFKFDDVSERDSYSKSKLIDSPGSLLEELFIVYIRNLKNNINKYLLETNPNEARKTQLYKQNNITHSEYIMSSFISSGSWGGSRKEAVCQLIQPLNYINELQLLRKFTNEQPKDDSTQSIIDKRVAGSEIQGFICTVTSPTSKNIGYHRYMSSLAQVTEYNYEYHFKAKEYIKSFYLNYKNDETKNNDKLKLNNISTSIKTYVESIYNVLLDGSLICKNVSFNFILDLSDYLNELRFNEESEYPLTNCHYIDDKSFYMSINTGGGRLITPVIKLVHEKEFIDDKQYNLKHKFSITHDEIKDIKTMKELRSKYPKVIDMIDINSINYKSLGYNIREIEKFQEDLKIRYKTDKIGYAYNYCLIDNSSIFSLALALSVLPNTTAGVRSLHEAKQSASSIGTRTYIDYLSNLKTDKLLISGTSNIINSNLTKYLYNNNITDKFNCFAQYKSVPKDQEDSYVVNKAAISRGMFAIMIFKTYSKEVDLKIGEKLMKPLELSTNSKNKINYSKINELGFVNVGETINQNDVLIYKVIPSRSTEVKTRPDIEIYEYAIPGRVIYTNTSLDKGKLIINIKIAQLYSGSVGDKLATACGQKGVIGGFEDSQNFGSNEFGFRSSIQISPSCMTRLTGSQLISPLLSQYSLISGNSIIHNQASNIDINVLRNYMKKFGCDDNFLTKLYLDKKQIFSINSVCVSILSFKRLKQIADNGNVKDLNAEVNKLTHNPTEGTRGGARLGKMEIDALLNHGVSNFLKSTYNYIMVDMCNNCGIHVDNNYCPLCESSSTIIKVNMPASLYLVKDYLFGLGIHLKMFVDNKNMIVSA